MNTYTGHEGAVERVSESIFPAQKLALGDAQSLAQRYRREYDAILARHFRGLETSWDTLMARLRWSRACSLVVDLSRKASKPLERLDERRGRRLPKDRGRVA